MKLKGVRIENEKAIGEFIFTFNVNIMKYQGEEPLRDRFDKVVDYLFNRYGFNQSNMRIFTTNYYFKCGNLTDTLTIIAEDEFKKRAVKLFK